MKLQLLQLLQLQLNKLQFQPINLLKTLKMIHPQLVDKCLNITMLLKKHWKLKKKESMIFPKLISTQSSKILDQLLKNSDNSKKLSSVIMISEILILRKKHQSHLPLLKQLTLKQKKNNISKSWTELRPKWRLNYLSRTVMIKKKNLNLLIHHTNTPCQKSSMN